MSRRMSHRLVGSAALAIVAAYAPAQIGTPVVHNIVELPAPAAPGGGPRLGLKVEAATVVTLQKQRPIKAVFGHESKKSPSTGTVTMTAVDGTHFSTVSLREGYTYCRLEGLEEEAFMRKALPIVDRVFDTWANRDQDAVRVPTETRTDVARALAPVLAFIWWPIVETHGVVAGADGTDVIVRALPDEDDAAVTHVWVILVEGSSCLVDFTDHEGNSDQELVGDAGDYIYLEVTAQEGGERWVTDRAGPDPVPASGALRDCFNVASADFAAHFN